MKHSLLRHGIKLLPLVTVVILTIIVLADVRPRSSSTAPKATNWEQRLRSTAPEKRREAVDALAQLAPDNPQAVRALIGVLRDRDAGVKRQAELALVKLGKAAVPELTTALQDDSRTVRLASARILSQIDPQSAAGVPVLIDALKEKTQRVAATATLVELGQPALPGLIAALQSPNPLIRQGAALVLRDLGAKAAPALGPLSAALQDPHRDVREAAVRALGQIGPDPQIAIPALLGRLADPDAGVRRDAVDVLGQVGQPAVGPLVQALQHEHKTIRQHASRALGQMGPDAKPVVDSLFAALTDPAASVRGEAARALVQLGTRNAQVVKALAASLTDEEFRSHALQALKECRELGVAAMIAALQAPDDLCRKETARALGQMGPEAASAVSALIATLKDKEWPVRREAAHALGRIGGDTDASVPALIDALKDSEAINRGEAAIALTRLGPRAKAAVPALILALADEDQGASQEAVKALVEIGPAAVPALQAATRSDQPIIRQQAAAVLKQLEK